MICKVVSASLGYNEQIYVKGDDIEVSTPSEVKRLLGYGHIEVGPLEEPLNKKVTSVAKPSKPPYVKRHEVKKRNGNNINNKL